jgi:beta-lactamase class D
LKTAWEVLATPLTYWVVGFLKRKENQDHFDVHTDFTPFKLKV